MEYAILYGHPPQKEEDKPAGCGKVLGHGDYCVKGHLCGACEEIHELKQRIKQLEQERT